MKINRSDLVKRQGRNGTEFGTVHGMRNTPTGNSWSAMMSRCFNKNYNGYPAYGGIGRTVCSYLMVSPRNLANLIGLRPHGTTLDRKDNSGSYTCGSCEQCISRDWPMNIRWATKKVQDRNKRTNVKVAINGKTPCVAELAEIYGIVASTIRGRLKRGYSGLDVICPIKHPIAYLINGQPKTVRQISEETGLKIKTLQKRIAMGITGGALIQPLNHAYVRVNYRTKTA